MPGVGQRPIVPFGHGVGQGIPPRMLIAAIVVAVVFLAVVYRPRITSGSRLTDWQVADWFRVVIKDDAGPKP